MNNTLSNPTTSGVMEAANHFGLKESAIQLSRLAPLALPTQLELRFWGTRGSIPVSGANHVRYGGNTSCVSLTSDTGHLFIFDCGSGLRELGNSLLAQDLRFKVQGSKLEETRLEILDSELATTKGYILLSHTHWDHIQGFPFFGPLFKAENQFSILGWANAGESLAEVLAVQMQQRYFPVSLYTLPAALSFHAVQPGQVTLDGATLTTRLLKHPLPSLGYRLELGGKAIVYATDHEPLRPPAPRPDALLGDDVIDPNLVALAQGADILIHDAQYSALEFSGKVGWGHSTIESAVDTAIKAGVKKLVLYHHDPAHDDMAIDILLAAARQRAIALSDGALEVVAAHDGLSLQL
jgi:phosphoribosyl 1,2-cyclic phosphodiesterase